MKSEWGKVNLGDVCDLIPGFAFKSKDFGSHPTKVVKIGDIQPPRVAIDCLEGVNLSSYSPNKLKKYLVTKGDFVLAMTGATIGKLGRFLADKPAYINQRVLRFKPKENVDWNFIYYVVNTKDFSGFVYNHIDSETAQPNISAGTLATFSFSIPPLPIQRKIASILSALDDKIETNNAICRNLEEQAKALYKSWFVDFESFGKQRPSNWKEKDIYSLCEIIYGAPFSSKLFNQDKKGLPLIRIRDLNKQESDVYTDEDHPKAYIIHAGDIVVGMDGEFSPYIWGGDAGLLNQRVCVFKNKRKKGSFFLYFSIKPQLEYIEQTEMATTVIHIGKKDFDAFSTFLPDEKVLDNFDEITFPFYEEIIQRRKENRRLTSIRESLLPRLMSGELTIESIK